MIRVVLVDDEQLVCAHLTTILERTADVTVVGTAFGGRQGVDLVVSERPDVVLMDVRMPDVDGIEAIRRLAELAPEIPVVALTTFEDDETVLGALEAGAAGFLLKSTAPAELATLVRAAAGGHRVLAVEALQRLLASENGAVSPRAPREVREGLAALTEREREVLEGIGHGRSNAEIATALFISEATVKGHVSRVLDKLGCTNRTQAGLIAARYAPPFDRPPSGGAPSR